MSIIVRKYCAEDIAQMCEIWNEVVDDGVAFPQDEPLNANSGAKFFEAQTFCGIAEENGVILGMYILHPNNVGRCGHISNASYAVGSNARGRGIGKALVIDSLKKAKDFGFGILQFNAVVSTNLAARRLYEKLGFVQLGTIPRGFLMKNGEYEDICPYYFDLSKLI